MYADAQADAEGAPADGGTEADIDGEDEVVEADYEVVDGDE